MMRSSLRRRPKAAPPSVDAMRLLCSSSIDSMSPRDREAIVEQVIRPTWQRMVSLPKRPSPAFVEQSLSTIADAIGRRCIPASRIRATSTAKVLATLAYQKGVLT